MSTTVIRMGDGLVGFEVPADSMLARVALTNTIRKRYEEHFGFVSAEQREQMVAYEVEGCYAAERALTTWCRCGDEVSMDESSYYMRDSGRHGFFHDPLKGGCGGITQTG